MNFFRFIVFNLIRTKQKRKKKKSSKRYYSRDWILMHIRWSCFFFFRSIEILKHFRTFITCDCDEYMSQIFVRIKWTRTINLNEIKIEIINLALVHRYVNDSCVYEIILPIFSALNQIAHCNIILVRPLNAQQLYVRETVRFTCYSVMDINTAISSGHHQT